jgi:peptidoglycan/xylan/chitin deacetylase (PgdA/CDA1 family)
MYWLIAILTILFVLFIVWVWTVAYVGSNVYIKTICKADVKDKVVALTFDDGPDEVMTEKVLDVLGKYNIKAIFFLVGSKAEKYPHIVRRIYSEGHIVANHTYSHCGNFPFWHGEKVEKELTKCAEAIQKIIGKKPKLFRPPFGVTNPVIGKVLRSLGFKTIGWSIRTMDTVMVTKREYIAQKVKRNLHPGAIILLHDRCPKADELLENIIESTLKEGYRFASLDKIIDLQAYED